MSPTRAADGAALARGTLLNVLGQGLPLVVALLCLPLVVRGLGAERFGILALSWTVLGYVGVLDLGLGRAAARFIAAALARGATSDVPRILGAALLAQTVFGVVGGALLVVATPALVVHVFGLPAGLQAEGRSTLQLVGLAVPVVVLSTSLRGALYAAERFDLVNAVLIPASSSMYLLSAAGVLAGWTLPAIVAVLVASKAVALVALWLLVRSYCPGMRGRRLSADRQSLHDLIGFGSWITVSSVVVPFVNQAERLLIPALLSVAALTFYAVPHEALSRAAIVPVSMALALFPAFSRLDARAGAALTALVARPMKYLALIMTPALAGVGLFADDVLGVWMGRAFANEAAPTLQLLSVAFYLNAFSYILRPAVQGLGRPDLKAKLDLAIAVLFVILLTVLTPRFGLIGAATARVFVMGVELASLLLLAVRAAPGALRPMQILGSLRPALIATAAYVVVAGGAVAWLRGSPLAYVSFAVLTVAHAAVFWIWVADATDRRTLLQLYGWLARGRRRVAPIGAGGGDVP